MSDVPTIKEELERKTSEWLTETLRSFSVGHISKLEAMASLQALWAAGSGLIDEDMAVLLADSIDAIRQEKDWPRLRVFMGSEQSIVMCVPDIASKSLVVKVLREGKAMSVGSNSNREGETLTEITKRSESFALKLIANGYTEMDKM